MNILEKLQAIQLELKVHKGQRNNFGKYNYRSAEDILEALKPMSKKYKVMFKVTEELVTQLDYLVIESVAQIFDLETDKVSSIESKATAVIDFDAKGMQHPQRTGAASSYAKKYALGNLLLIDDTKDSDATNTHGKSTQTKPELKVGSAEFKKVLEAVKKGYTIQQVELKYSVSDKVKELLNK